MTNAFESFIQQMTASCSYMKPSHTRVWLLHTQCARKAVDMTYLLHRNVQTPPGQCGHSDVIDECMVTSGKKVLTIRAHDRLTFLTKMKKYDIF